MTSSHFADSERLSTGIPGLDAILNGSPFFAIREATQPNDLLILTSHGRGGVQRWLLGSVAEKLVREANAPVLLVPALERDQGDEVSGIISPITP